MYKTHENHSVTKSYPSPLVQEVMTVAQNELWDFNVLGKAPMPETPVRLGKWLIVPAIQDQTEIPEKSLERVRKIYAAGVRPKGFLIVHEAPLFLPPPKQSAGKQTKPFWMIDPKKIKNVLRIAGIVISVLAVVTVGLALVAAAISVVGVSVLLLAIAALIDPILVVVTEDDYWIEIDRWWI